MLKIELISVPHAEIRAERETETLRSITAIRLRFATRGEGGHGAPLAACDVDQKFFTESRNFTLVPNGITNARASGVAAGDTR